MGVLLSSIPMNCEIMLNVPNVLKILYKKREIFVTVCRDVREDTSDVAEAKKDMEDKEDTEDKQDTEDTKDTKNIEDTEVTENIRRFI